MSFVICETRAHRASEVQDARAGVRFANKLWRSRSPVVHQSFRVVFGGGADHLPVSEHAQRCGHSTGSHVFRQHALVFAVFVLFDMAKPDGISIFLFWNTMIFPIFF